MSDFRNSTECDGANRELETAAWADRVAAACIDRYNALPRAGKPRVNEWAPLSGVVVFVPTAATCSTGVVSSPGGSALQPVDVLAKRNFLCDTNLACDNSGNYLKRQDNFECETSETTSDNVTVGINTLTSVRDSSSSDNKFLIEKTNSFNVTLNLGAVAPTPTNTTSPEESSSTFQKIISTSNEIVPSSVTLANQTTSGGTQSRTSPLQPKGVDLATKIVQDGEPKFQTSMESSRRGVASHKEDVASCQTTISSARGVASQLEGWSSSYENSMSLLTEGTLTCVSLGTGSKCLGGSELRGGGDLVHDSHAEVLARRGFVRYLVHQAERALATGDSEVLEMGPDGRCRVRRGVSFHMFVSEPPCGDAAIFLSDDHALHRSKQCTGKRPREEGADCATSAKRFSRGIPKTAASPRSVQGETAQENAERITSQSIAQASTQEMMRALMKTPAKATTQNLIENLQPKKAKNFQTVSTISQDTEIASTEKASQVSTENLLESVQAEKAKNFQSVSIVSQRQEANIVLTAEIGQCPTENLIGNVQPKEANNFCSVSTMLRDPDDASTEEISQDSERNPIETARPKQAQDFRTVSTAPHVAADAPTAPSGDDVHRTGAKCVGGGAQDRRAPGAGYHVTGAVRTKPGRGDPTLSLSCSDKMARWHAVGAQGALASLLVPRPVRFRSVAMAGGVSWSAAALRRARAERAGRDPAALAVAQGTLRSPAARDAACADRPSAAGLAWCDVPHRPLEVVARGRKQGVTKKTAATAAGRLAICRKELAREFVRVFSTFPHLLAVARLQRCRPEQQTPSVDGKQLGLDSEGSRHGPQNPGLNAPVFVIAAGQTTSASQQPVTGVVADRKQNLFNREPVDDGLSCRNRGLTILGNEPQALDEVNVRALSANLNVSGGDLQIDALETCLAGGEVANSSIAKTSESKHDVDFTTDCGRLVNDGGLGQMTYARLKAMASDYQRDWRRVRETHFPAWPAKPSGLQDFVVDDG